MKVQEEKGEKERGRKWNKQDDGTDSKSSKRRQSYHEYDEKCQGKCLT